MGANSSFSTLSARLDASNPKFRGFGSARKGKLSFVIALCRNHKAIPHARPLRCGYANDATVKSFT